MAKTAPRSRALIWLTISTIFAFAVLVWLGTWQLQRLGWKTDLITKIEARIHEVPVALDEAVTRFASGQDVDYLKLTASGTFDLDQELYYFTVISGQVGWLVYSPFETAEGVLLVNRGFVRNADRDPANRQTDDEIITHELVITGLVREAQFPVLFVPDNEPDANNWYWRDINAMANALDIRPETIIPFSLDLQTPSPASGMPQTGVTRVSIANRHLGYVYTWYGLAVALLIIYLILARKLRRASQ